MVYGEVIPRATIDTAVTIPFENILTGEVDLFVRYLDVAVETDDGGIFKVPAYRTQTSFGIGGEHLGFL